MSLATMALGASWQEPGRLPAGLADRQRRRRAFQNATRHSRLVRRLRIVLPIGGALILAGMAAATRLGLPENLDLTAARLSVTRNAIIMESPRLTGFDKKSRQYAVQADRAIQQLSNPDAVRLENITATLKDADEGAATISAEAGDYDNAEEKLVLHGGIAVSSSEGYALTMTGADIDLNGGTISSPNPVRISYRDMLTTAKTLSVTGGGRLIVLEGGVRTTLRPPKSAPSPGPVQE